MNIFQDLGAFYGNSDRMAAGDSLLSIFRQAKLIRLQLGQKGYLLDNYLDLVFQGFDLGDLPDAIEKGVDTAYGLQRALLSDVVEGKEPETPHPLYKEIQKIYDRHSKVHAFQEHRTRLYLLTALAEKELLEYAVSAFMGSQEQYWLGSGEIVSLCELYDAVSSLVGDAQIDELNSQLKSRFQICSAMSAFIQGFTNDLQYQLTWRDPETSKQIFQLLLDILPEND